MAFKIDPEFELRLTRMSQASPDICEQAVFAGAKVLADAIRARLESLPTEPYRHLKDGEQFDGVPRYQKRDLVASFGVTPIQRSYDGYVTAKIGFDGYGSQPTKAYPQGLPNQMVARAIESGSSVRKKHPFVAPAVRANKKAAEEAMVRAADEAIKKIMEG